MKWCEYAYVWCADDGGGTPVQDEHQASEDEAAAPHPAEVHTFKPIFCSVYFINE